MVNFKLFKDLTIIIVLFKEPLDLIKKTLEQIQNLKIIIIDNANDLELKKTITSSFKISKYILNKKNNGFSAGYNQGIKLSDSKYTLVLRPDCLISKRDIKLLLETICKYDNTTLVIPTSYDKNNNLTYAGGLLSDKFGKSEVLQLEGDVCVENVLGACMLFKTQDFKERIIYFDENFFLYFSDDDLCRRLKFLKKPIIQVYEAKCIHIHGIIKVNNKYKKIFIREFNFTYDKFYYFYKVDKHKSEIDTFKKKIPKYVVRFFIKIFTFQFQEALRLFSRLFAYYKFKRKYF